MKTIRYRLLLLALIAVGMAAAAAEETNQVVKTDLAQLQGEWSMVSGSVDGQAMPDSLRGESKRVCKGDEVTVTVAGQIFMKAKFTIDPSKKPKTIDYQVLDGPAKGKTLLGIYELEGDTFKSCFGAPEAERPKDYTGKPGERRTSSVWKRDQK